MSDSKSLTPALQDKALWLTAFTMLAPLLAVLFHVQVDPSKLAALATAYVVPAVTFVLAHKAKSAAIVLKELETSAAKAVLVDAPVVQGTPEKP